MITSYRAGETFELLGNNHNNLLAATLRRMESKYRSSGNDSNAGKVTVGLASHWPRVTDSVVYVPTGLIGPRNGDEHHTCGVSHDLPLPVLLCLHELYTGSALPPRQSFGGL